MEIAEVLGAGGTAEEIVTRLSGLMQMQPRISFAQAGEDIFIVNYLRRFQPEGGTFIDFGAHHPWRFSNTFALYILGWRGINVEPNPEQIPLFDKFRPEDQNIQAAIGTEKGTLKLRRYEDAAYNKIIAPGQELARDDAGKPKVDEIQVQSLTANEVLAMAGKNRQIDLLTIDIEGLDEPVLRTIDFKTYRPRLVCAEIPPERSFSPEFAAWLRSVGYRPLTQCINSLFAIPE